MATGFGASKKSRHIDLKYLYIQYLVKDQLVTIYKCSGTNNPADLFTKHVDAAVLLRLVEKIGIYIPNNNYVLACIRVYNTTSMCTISTSTCTSLSLSCYNIYVYMMKYVIYIGNVFYMCVKYVTIYAHHFIYEYMHASMHTVQPQPSICIPQPSTQPFLSLALHQMSLSTQRHTTEHHLCGPVDDVKLRRLNRRIKTIKE